MEVRSPRTWAHTCSHSHRRGSAGRLTAGVRPRAPPGVGGRERWPNWVSGQGLPPILTPARRTARRRWPFTRSRAPLTVARLPLRRGPRVKAGQACSGQRTWSPLRTPWSSLSDRADGTSQVPNRPMRSHSHATCDKGEMRGSGRGFLKQRMSVRSVSGVS